MDRSLVVISDVTGRKCVLIDSGYSEAPDLLDFLKSRGRRPAAVLCTHFHVDHMGNNGLLQREAGSKIYAAALEIEVQRSRNVIRLLVRSREDRSLPVRSQCRSAAYRSSSKNSSAIPPPISALRPRTEYSMSATPS